MPGVFGTVNSEQTRALCLLIMRPEVGSGRLPTMHVTRDELVDGQYSAVMPQRFYYPVSSLLAAVIDVIFMACGVTQ
jgi:hypothetical protein